MKPRPTFDALAPHYEWLERLSFGSRLQACRIAMLPFVADCRRVLIVGDGDGRFLSALLDVVPHATIDSLDISPGMIRLAQRRKGITDRVQFHVADVRTDPLPGNDYDLIVTNFLLDCFPADELAKVIDRLSAAAAPVTRWIVGDFAVARGRLAKPLSRMALSIMYLFFRLTTKIPAQSLADPNPILVAQGWIPSRETSWLSGFLVSRLWMRSRAT